MIRIPVVPAPALCRPLAVVQGVAECVSPETPTASQRNIGANIEGALCTKMNSAVLFALLAVVHASFAQTVSCCVFLTPVSIPIYTLYVVLCRLWQTTVHVTRAFAHTPWSTHVTHDVSHVVQVVVHVPHLPSR